MAESAKEKIAGASLVLILAHGDLDGIVSAVMLTKICESYGAKVETVFTLPKWISTHANTSVYDLIVIVDVPANNRNVQSAKRFAEKHKDKLVWIDHHHYPADIPEITSDPSYKSCVSLLKEMFPMDYGEETEELIRLAHLTDQGHGDNVYHEALKVNQRRDETRYEIYRLGVSHPKGEIYRKSADRIKRRAEYYKNILVPNTNYMVQNNSRIAGSVSFVDIRNERDKPIDMTLLAFKLYEKSPFVVIKYYGSNRKENEFLKISARPGVSVNLVELFGLRSGARFKVTIPNEYDDSELVKKLEDALEKSEEA